MTMLNPAVLQNKGIPVKIYVTEPYVRERSTPTISEKGELVQEIHKSIAWRPMIGDDDALLTTKEWLKLDANALAQIEQHFNGMEGFQKASEVSTNDSIRIALTIAFGFNPKDEAELAQVGARLIPAEFGSYQNALMASLSMASGVDPTNAARLLEEGRLGVKDQIEAANAELVKALEEAAQEREAEEAKRLAEEEARSSAPETSPSEQEQTDTPGSDGSASGSGSDAPTTSSGA